MKRKLFMMVFAPAVAFGLSACSVDQTEEGDLPEVEVEGGALPEYDVDAADVDVNTDTQQVVVPDVDVTMPEDTTAAN